MVSKYFHLLAKGPEIVRDHQTAVPAHSKIIPTVFANFETFSGALADFSGHA